jgi:hypothetical protein
MRGAGNTAVSLRRGSRIRLSVNRAVVGRPAEQLSICVVERHMVRQIDIDDSVESP